jgi:hypothetical protein
MGDVSVHRHFFEKQKPICVNGRAVFQSGYAIYLIGPGMGCDPFSPHEHWLEVSFELVSYLPYEN